ncbi:hypothetical protein [Myxococcus faecalis]|uniref:hypothetical protein n=1 Tax=Myxococcus faecalis TaxID=3115646 RepID=UPI003CF5D689
MGESIQMNITASLGDRADGNDVFCAACKELSVDSIQLIVKTARWVHPDTFRYLPVWYPEAWRKADLYDVTWSKRSKNKGSDKFESNVRAGKALKAALGGFQESNWACCHIWGFDDPSFSSSSEIVTDPRYYTCVANMILVPSALKALTDAVEEVKLMLRVCAWHTYGWVCEEPIVKQQADRIKSGFIPQGYPKEWPRGGEGRLPPGTMPFTEYIRELADQRLSRVASEVHRHSETDLPFFPKEKVLSVLRFWNVQLPAVNADV